MARLTVSLITTIRREWVIDGLGRRAIAKRHRLAQRVVYIVCTIGRPVCPKSRPPRGDVAKLCASVPWTDDVVARLQLLAATGMRVSYHRTRLNKLTVEQSNELRDLHAAGWKQCELAKRFGLSQAAVSDLVTGKSYRDSLLTRALELRAARAAAPDDDGDDDGATDDTGPHAQSQVALWPSGYPMRRQAR